VKSNGEIIYSVTEFQVFIFVDLQMLVRVPVETVADAVSVIIINRTAW
jgi:hypothetical protein